MKISIITAFAENNVIGNNNKLIWYISEDLKRFKKITSGNSIIMGRKTYISLPFRPLPKRKNIVISKNKNLVFKGATLVSSPENALEICKNETEIFICGGASIYEYFLPFADKIYLTKIFHNFKGDTFFPKINFDNWKLINKIEKNGKYKFSFLDYERQTKI